MSNDIDILKLLMGGILLRCGPQGLQVVEDQWISQLHVMLSKNCD